jgi:hypothetical protein
MKDRYLTDANPYGILAILATASPLQVAAIRDFIWRNITFHTFLGVRIAVRTNNMLFLFPNYYLIFYIALIPKSSSFTLIIGGHCGYKF